MGKILNINVPFMSFNCDFLPIVNNFQNIRLSLLEEESQIEQHKKLAMELNVFGEEKG